MLRVSALLCLVAAAVAQDAFIEVYARQKIMTTCFGEELYYGQLAQLTAAKEQCNQQPIFLPALQHTPNTYNVITPGFQRPNVGYNYPAPPSFPSHILTPGYQRPVQGRERTTRQTSDQVFLDREGVLALVDAAHAALSNYTCLMRGLQVVDDNLNIRIDNIQRQYYQAPMDPNLRQDQLQAVDLCYQLSSCLPVEKTQSPIPQQLQRILFFSKCEQEQRIAKCFKHDLRRNLRYIDASALPDATQEGRLEKLATIFALPALTEELSGF